jgi:hypothetical protein
MTSKSYGSAAASKSHASAVPPRSHASDLPSRSPASAAPSKTYPSTITRSSRASTISAPAHSIVAPSSSRKSCSNTSGAEDNLSRSRLRWIDESVLNSDKIVIPEGYVRMNFMDAMNYQFPASDYVARRDVVPPVFLLCEPGLGAVFVQRR